MFFYLLSLFLTLSFFFFSRLCLLFFYCKFMLSIKSSILFLKAYRLSEDCEREREMLVCQLQIFQPWNSAPRLPRFSMFSSSNREKVLLLLLLLASFVYLGVVVLISDINVRVEKCENVFLL